MIHRYVLRSRKSLVAACCTLLAAGTLAACADAPSAATQTTELATGAASASATLALTRSFANGYCAAVTLTNLGSAPAASWTVVINLNQSRPTFIRGAVQTTSAGAMTATPGPTQAALAPGSKYSFTFCATKTGSNYVPTITSVTGLDSGPTTGAGGSATGAGGSPTSTGGSTGTSTGGSTGTSDTPAPAETVTSAAQACANTPMSQTGTIYYACDCGSGADADCRPGNDGSDGKTPATAWRTYQKLQSQFASMKPGDTLAFCRGGSFTGTGDTQPWVNAGCKAGNVCTVRDYQPSWGSGDEGLPKLVGGSLSLANGGNATHQEGYQFLNLELDGPGTGDAVFVYNDIKDVLFCDLVIDNYDIGVNVEGSNPTADSTSDGRNARITLRGSRVVNNANIGWLGSCAGCAVEYNDFDHNGANSEFDHGIYMSGVSDASGNAYVATGERVVGNQVFHSAMGSGNTCGGVALVVHGKHDGLLIQGNTVAQDLGTAGPGCWGIAVMAAYSTPESFTNLTVDGNTVTDMGTASIFMDSCQGCKVQNNLVIQGQTAFGSAGITVHPNGTRDAADQMQSAVQVLENTVYFAANVQSTGIMVGGEGSGYVVAGNAVLGSTSGGWSCLDYDLATSAYYSDYNLCYDPASAGSWVQEVGSLATWQAKGLDKHSKVADPLFIKPALTGYDFTAQPGSPLRGAGDPAHAPATDITGRTRPSPPDIGAYQN